MIINGDVLSISIDSKTLMITCEGDIRKAVVIYLDEYKHKYNRTFEVDVNELLECWNEFSTIALCRKFKVGYFKTVRIINDINLIIKNNGSATIHWT